MRRKQAVWSLYVVCLNMTDTITLKSAEVSRFCRGSVEAAVLGDVTVGLRNTTPFLFALLSSLDVWHKCLVYSYILVLKQAEPFAWTAWPWAVLFIETGDSIYGLSETLFSLKEKRPIFWCGHHVEEIKLDQWLGHWTLPKKEEWISNSLVLLCLLSVFLVARRQTTRTTGSVWNSPYSQPICRRCWIKSITSLVNYLHFNDSFRQQLFSSSPVVSWQELLLRMISCHWRNNGHFLLTGFKLLHGNKISL